MQRLPRCDDERYLVLIDHDDDVQELLTVICDGRPQATRSDLTDRIGGAS